MMMKQWDLASTKRRRSDEPDITQEASYLPVRSTPFMRVEATDTFEGPLTEMITMSSRP
jgi:hypothetical protein